MDIISFFKGLYYRAEDKWYDFLDAIDRRQIPVYKIIDPVDRVVPSFLLFILIIIFILVLIAYLMQFYSPLEVTFIAVDSSNQTTLEGVAIAGTINEMDFSKVTGSKGEAKLIIKGKPANLFEKIGSLFFAKEEKIIAILSAEKSGYTKIQKREYDLSSKEAKITLTSLGPGGNGDDGKKFASSVEVELLDNATGQRIADPSGTAFIKYNCANKGISIKTSSDGHDGVIDGKFKLIEVNCNFVVKGAYAEGYNRLDNVNMELDPNESLQAVRLSKTSTPTKGTVKIFVYELNSDPKVPLTNIQIRLLDLSGNSMEDGATDFSGIMQKEVFPGTYLITATSPDGNYFALTSDMNQLIVANLDSLTEKTIYLKKMDPALVRFLRIKVVDYNGRTPLKDVLVFPQQLVLTADGNRSARGVVGSCSNSCKTDSNGIVVVSGLSSEDEGKVVVSLFKDNYISKFFEPQFFRVNSADYQIVELEKADYDPNTGNSGKGLVKVKAKNNSSGIITTAYMYFNSSELNIGGISVLQSGIRTDSNGEALFTGLRNTNLKAYYAKASYDGVEGVSQNKAIDVGQTVIFDINIDTEVSFLEVRLLGYGGFNIVDKDKAVVKIIPADITSSTPQFETLTYNASTQTFKSRLHERGRTYLISIDLNNYVPTQGTKTLELIGRNEYNETLYPNNENILVVFKGLFEQASSTKPADLLDLNHSLDSSSKGYYAKIDVVVGKSLKDGNILGALRLDGNMDIMSFTTTQDYFKQAEIYACTPSEKTPYNDDNYYIQSDDCIKSDSNIGKQLGVNWDGNVASGVYNITSAIKFTPNAKNGQKVDLNSSAKQNDYNSPSSEDKDSVSLEIGSSMCRVTDNPSCPGLFFNAELNGTSLGSELFDYNYTKKRFSNFRIDYKIEKDYANPLRLQLFNNSSARVDVNLTVYAFANEMDSFNNTESGFFHFDSNDGPQKKVIGSVSINSFDRSTPMDVNVFTLKEKSKSYIVAVAEISNGEKYFLFINAISQGRNMFLNGGNFASGVPDQTFNSSVLDADEQPVEINSVEWEVLGGCVEGSVLKEGTGTINEVDKHAFSMTIPGVYEYEKDCLKVRVVAKDPIYRELNETFMAGTGGIDDPELGCTTIGVIDSPNNNDAYLQWGNLNKVILKNNCAEEVKLQFESRLLLLDTEQCSDLDPNQTCTVLIKATNSDYDPAVKFSDVLGVFPVYIRAKLASSRKNFSQVKMIKVHVLNSAECFSISKDVFDLKTAPEQTEFFVTNNCQYTDFKDYFIPGAYLKLSGVDLNDARQKYDYINFDYNINVRGGSYELQTNQILRTGIKLNFPESVMDHPASAVSGSTLKKYTGFKAEIAQKLNAVSDHMMFRWTDTSENDLYGAKIDGAITVNYYDRGPAIVTPSFNFDFSSGTIACTGSDPVNSSNHCMANVPEEVPNGNDDSMRYGLFYVHYPKGKIKSIEYNIIGDPDPNILIVYTNIFVDYNEAQTVPVESGESTTNTIATGTFTIYPIEGMTFLLRNYSNPRVTQEIQDKSKLCKLVLTNKAWVGDGSVYWIQKNYNNYAGANRYCTDISNRLFAGNNDYGVATTVPQSVIDGWMANQAQFSWMGVGNGFWTNDCTDTTCKVISKTDAGFGSTLIDMDKTDVDSYVPFCRQAKSASLFATPESCAALGIVCDAASGVCSESTPALFDSFLAEGFVEVLNPTTSVEVTRARSNNVDVNNSTVMIWIEGGILKAMFLGKNYVGYDDSSIELEIVPEDVVGDLYGTLNIVDYVNRK